MALDDLMVLGSLRFFEAVVVDRLQRCVGLVSVAVRAHMVPSGSHLSPLGLPQPAHTKQVESGAKDEAIPPSVLTFDDSSTANLRPSYVAELVHTLALTTWWEDADQVPTQLCFLTLFRV